MKNNADSIKGLKAANTAYNVMFVLCLTFILNYLLLSLCSSTELAMLFNVSVVYEWLYTAGEYCFASLALKVVVPVIALLVIPILAAWLLCQMFRGAKKADSYENNANILSFTKLKDGDFVVSPFSKKAIKKEWWVGALPFVFVSLSYFLLMNNAFGKVDGYMRVCVLTVLLLVILIALLTLPALFAAYVGKWIFFKDTVKRFK